MGSCVGVPWKIPSPLTARAAPRVRADRLAMSAQEKAAARDAILAAERLSDESSAVRVVRAICVTFLAVGSVTCILVALLGPRTSSMKIPLLSAPPLAQLTLDDSLRKPSISAPPPPARVRKAHAVNAAKAHAAAAPDGGTCYTFGHNARGEQFCIANEQARVWCARHTTPKLSRTSRTAYVWMAAHPSCCADGECVCVDGMNVLDVDAAVFPSSGSNVPSAAAAAFLAAITLASARAAHC